MKRYLIRILSVFSFFCLLACGKKGPLEPPVIRVPKDIELVQLIQRGRDVIIQWRNPTQYIDGNPIGEISRVEIWKLEKERAASASQESTTGKDFKKEGELLAAIQKEAFADYAVQGAPENPVLQFVLPLDKNFLEKEYHFSFRVADVRMRSSDYSPAVVFYPSVLPLPPDGLRAEVREDRISLGWDPPQKNIDGSEPPKIFGYNLYRSGEEGTVRVNSGLIAGLVYEDKEFVFGNTYVYRVRASASPSSPFMESDDSEGMTVIPEDVFPPGPPQGLVAVAGPGVLSLSWETSPERDAKGYRVWRKAGDESDFVVLTPEPVLENVFTDAAVEKNKRYYYAITAMDEAGNESRKSSSVSEILREGLP